MHASRCMTLLLPPGPALTPGALGVLLAFVRRRSGAEPWDGVQADVFRGPGGTLLIVRETLCTARLADYALPYLHKYFTNSDFFSCADMI